MRYDGGLRNKTVLVTGATGFIGSRLCSRLSEMEVKLHGVSRRKVGPTAHPVRWWQGELADFADVENILAAIRPHVIFHLASHVVGARQLNVVLPTFRSNLVTTVNLLTMASTVGCERIILAGSLEEPGGDDAGCVPCSPYAAAKWSSSGYARMFHALFGTPVTIARLFMVYGPGQQDLNKVIPYVILSLLRRQAPQLTSGQRLVDWIYVDDVVEALIAVAQAERVEGETIDVGSGALVSVRTVVQQLVNMIGGGIESLFGSLPERPMEQVRVADLGVTFEKTGWSPRVSLEEGLKRTIDWYRNMAGL